MPKGFRPKRVIHVSSIRVTHRLGCLRILVEFIASGREHLPSVFNAGQSYRLWSFIVNMIPGPVVSSSRLHESDQILNEDRWSPKHATPTFISVPSSLPELGMI